MNSIEKTQLYDKIEAPFINKFISNPSKYEMNLGGGKCG